MKFLFSTESLSLLSRFLLTKPLLAFDYDGTLTKLIANPKKAKLGLTTRRRLDTLNGQRGIAIITGRSRADIKPLLGFRPRYLVGNHGLEGSVKKAHLLMEHRQLSRSWKKQLAPFLSAQTAITLEDKVFSLTLHFRKARQQAAAEKKILRWAKQLHPAPRVICGKFVVNLVPRKGPHKGSTLLEIMKSAGARTAFYIGDDETDEDVFRLRQKRLFTVRVGEGKATAAQYFVKGQSQVNALLQHLEREMSGAAIPTALSLPPQKKRPSK